MINKVYHKKQPVEIAPDIFLLGGGSFFNLYLICGKDKTALVELGISCIVDKVIDQIKEVGIKPDFLILTHPHNDHITGWNRLHQEYPHARLLLEHKAYEFIKNPKNIKIMFHEDKYIHEQFLKKKYHIKSKPVKTLLNFNNPIIIKKKTNIDLGQISINCIPVKGHSHGNIIVEVPERKSIFVSDSLGYQTSKTHIPMFLTSFTDYVKTIDEIISLKANIIGPAHYGPFLGNEARDIVRLAKKEALHFYKKISLDIKENNFFLDDIFNKINVGLLSNISKKSMWYCANLLVNNVKKASKFYG